jgi:hypothetical protein
MNKFKALFLVAAIAAIGFAVTAVWIARQRQHQLAELQDLARKKAARAAELAQLGKESKPVVPPAVAPTVSPQPLPENPQAPQPTNTTRLPDLPSPAAAAPPGQPTQPRRELQDPLARVALSFVGADADAEAYWLQAIYDPNLPDQEREDLMEDLNEDGLSDPRHPGPQDYPLIMNRIRLIDQIVPNADQFMLPHLWEAYKDLWNLSEVAQGRGEPVR